MHKTISMSLFGDLKKVFFGAKAVAKNQGRKAAEAAREIGADLREQAAEATEAAKEKLEDVAENITEHGSELAGKGKEALEGLGDKIWEEADTAADKGRELRDNTSDWINERLGSLNTSGDNSAAEMEQNLSAEIVPDVPPVKPNEPLDFESDLDLNPPPAADKEPSAAGKAANEVLDRAAKAGLEAKAAAEKLGEKVMDVSEKIGGKVMEKGSELLDRATEAGASIKEKADDLLDRATAEAEKENMEDTIEKAKAAAAQAEARARAFDGKETTRDTSDSILDGTDSFFDRAARFADGDYHREGSVTISNDENKPAPKPNDNITGFTDQDGDGDALIDDAEIEEES